MEKNISPRCSPVACGALYGGGGVPFSKLILRNGYFAHLCHLFFPVSHDDF